MEHCSPPNNTATLKSNDTNLPYLNYLILLLVLLTACGQTPIQADAITETETEEASENTPINSIQQIKEAYSVVEKLFFTAQLKLDSLDYECENDRKGGILNYYKQGEQLRLIKHAYYEGDHSAVTEEFYLKDGKLFFAFVEESYWMFDSELPENTDFDPTNPPTKDVIKEFRYYFQADGTPLQCLEKEYVIRSAIELPVDPNLVANQEGDCAKAADVRVRFQHLAQLEIVEDMRAAMCE